MTTQIRPTEESKFNPVTKVRKSEGRIGGIDFKNIQLESCELSFITAAWETAPQLEIPLRHCSKEARGRTVYTYILPAKFCLVKAMVFPVVMYGCESWTVKKAER